MRNTCPDRAPEQYVTGPVCTINFDTHYLRVLLLRREGLPFCAVIITAKYITAVSEHDFRASTDSN